jgi:acyl carrier protein
MFFQRREVSAIHPFGARGDGSALYPAGPPPESAPEKTEVPCMLQQPFEQEIARLIVETLQLEITPDAIAPEAALFNEGLGLDSIDALELVLAISRGYGIEMKADDERNGQIFASLRNLARFVETHRQ